MGTFQTGFTFKKSTGTNGAQLPGLDYISGLLFYGSAPALFPASGVKQCFSVNDAIAAGITPDHTDETQAVAIITLVDTGLAGQTIGYTVQEPINPLNLAASPNLVTLCLYTKIAGDAISATTYAANVAAAINANQATTGGYTATSALGVITLTARKGLGVFLNTGAPLAQIGTDVANSTITGAFGSAIDGATLGVASKLDVYYYHISEYFKMNPNGNLWVGLFAINAAYSFVELQTLQILSGGTIRRAGVYAEARTIVTNGAADTDALNLICTIMDTNKMPMSAFLAEDMHSVTDLTTLINLSLRADEWVSVNISQDGAAQGWTLYQAYAKSITNIGALVGASSVGSVSECFANPIPKFNISDGTENELPAIANNTLFSSVSTGLQTQLDNYRYIYAGNYTGYTGTYFNDSHCAVISNNKYAYVENNLVEAKIERLLYLAYLPILKSQLSLNADGTIAGTIITSLQSIGNNTLNINMVTNGELSQVECIVNPLQNVTATGKLVIVVYEINNPIARSIEVDVNPVSILP